MSNLRERFLAENNGIVIVAAAEFARGLNRDDPESFRAGYSRANALLAAVELFPEVTETEIQQINDWEVDNG